MVNFALLKSAVGYADDTSNSNSQVAGLNSESEVLVNLSKELGLVLNPTKTQCIIYSSVADSADVSMYISDSLEFEHVYLAEAHPARERAKDSHYNLTGKTRHVE